MKTAATTVVLLVLLTLVGVLTADVTAVMAFFAPNITYPDAVLQHNDSPAAWDVFGRSIGVSGDTIVVGAPGDDNGGFERGSAYAFDYNGSAWVQTKLVAPENTSSTSNNDQFGTSVAIDGDIIVVGEFADGAGDNNWGAAHIFERIGGNWTWVRKLTVAGLPSTARLGYKVAASGNRVAVTSIGTARVYIFDRDAGSGGWTAAPVFASGTLGTSFGEDISLSGDDLLVGARLAGAAYVYDCGINCAFRATLSGPISEAFAYSLSISGDTAAVGAPGASTGGIISHGAIYVFERNPSTGSWGSPTKLITTTASQFAATGNDQMGTDVDIAGDMIVAGAWGDLVYAEGSGSAYVFMRSGGVWTETNKLIQPASGFGTGVLYHVFGRAVGTTGYRAVVGAPMYVNNSNPPLPGHAYVFDLAEPPAPIPPEATTLEAPSGSINSDTPTYSWDAVASSTWYYLWVDGPSGNVIKQWYTAAQAGCGGGTGTCSVTPALYTGDATELADGDYRWWVQTFNDVGTGPWSAREDFNVLTSVPAAATLTSPMGATPTRTPTYTWEGVASSTWYYLWVDGPGGVGNLRNWYTAAQVGCGGGGTCSVAPSIALGASGDAKWWVQTYNQFGGGAWSARGDFTVTGPGSVPPAATLISPSGTGSSGSPTYTWNAVGGSTWYLLWVGEQGSTTPLYQRWLTAADTLCASGVGTCSATPTPGGPYDPPVLEPGNYAYYIRTWNPGGDGPWSAQKVFTVQ